MHFLLLKSKYITLSILCPEIIDLFFTILLYFQPHRVKFSPGQTLPLRGQPTQPRHQPTDDSSLGSFAGAANTTNNSGVVPHESNEHDADIDEFSDGLTTQDNGEESTEPEQGSSMGKDDVLRAGQGETEMRKCI